jgi:release factor glutamine methyltransferase
VANNIDAALSAATAQLSNRSDTARLDAELLMAHALGVERGQMLLQRGDLQVPDTFNALIERRVKGEPVAYIIGQQDFWDLTLKVTPDVLIPRSDSETLIEAAQAHFANREAPTKLLDLGTGSGALLLAAMSLFPGATGTGIDASEAALAIAAENAERTGRAARCTYLHRSWRTDGWTGGLSQYDLILCNPPYVEAEAPLDRSVRHFEPASALFSGTDGLDDYAILIPQIPALLAPSGIAIYELGKGQLQAVSKIAKDSGLSAHARCDLAGIARALILSASVA